MSSYPGATTYNDLSRGFTDDMDDCVAAGAAAVVAFLRLRQGENQDHRLVGTRSGVARRGRCSYVPGRQESMSLAQRCLHGTVRPASWIRVVVKGPHDEDHVLCHATVGCK